ncbi:MAG: PstA family ABC transporter permease, partial [Candidatus Micrarchaeia archaeon]
MKNRFEGVYFKLIEATAFASVAMLVAVVLFLLYFGWDVFSAGFFTDSWNHQDISSAGIFQAIFGTLVLVIGVFVVSVPIGISSAIYLTEYARSSWGVRLIRLAIRNLAGVPSIVYGLFGLVLFVQFFSFGPSLVAAVLTLALMTLPWNISASEEAIKTVP